MQQCSSWHPLTWQQLPQEPADVPQRGGRHEGQQQQAAQGVDEVLCESRGLRARAAQASKLEGEAD